MVLAICVGIVDQLGLLFLGQCDDIFDDARRCLDCFFQFSLDELHRLPHVAVGSIVFQFGIMVNEFFCPITEFSHCVELVQAPFERRHRSLVPAHRAVVARNRLGPFLFAFQRLLEQAGLFQEQSVHVNLADRSFLRCWRNGLHACVELVNDGDSRRDCDLLNLLIANIVNRLDEPTQRVGMRHHQNVATALQLVLDLLLPQRARTFHAIQQGFRHRNLIDRQIGVLAITSRPVLISHRQGWRTRRQRSAPFLHHFMSQLLGRLLLTQTRQCTVHPLIQSP
mmetsp:Transcript_15129/g.42658  ORF Transcript_15129/g.42658 Transcript_15129/m.42658 type:complete len:281 (+) Transcript_15129:1288-2130(+)